MIRYKAWFVAGILLITCWAVAVLPVLAQVQIDMGTLLEGDATNQAGISPDGVVNGYDFNALKNSFLKNEGDPGYDPQADFDRSLTVNGYDFNLMKESFLKEAPMVVYDLAVTDDGNGTTDPSGTTAQVASCTIAVSGSPSSTFLNWSGDTEYLDSAVDVASNSVTYTGTQSITISLQANFAAE